MKLVCYVAKILLFFTSAFTTQAQLFPVLHYSIAEGVAHSNVFSVYQDKQGFLFFGTNNGLSVFNSKEFQKKYLSNERTANTILSVTTYRNNGLLLSTYGSGLFIKNDYYTKKIIPSNAPIPPIVISSEYDGNNIWIVAQDSINRLYRLSNNILKPIKIFNEDKEDAQVFKVIKSREQHFAATSAGIFALKKDGTIHPIWKSHKPVLIKDFSFDKNNGYWIGLENKLLHISDGREIAHYDFKDEATISDLLLLKNGDLWVATISDGIYELKSGKLTSLRNKLDLTKVIITNMLEVDGGEIWLTTQGQGVYRILGRNIAIYKSAQNGLNGNCSSLSAFDSNVLIGSYGKIALYKNNEVKIIPSKKLHPDDNIYFIEKVGNYFYIGTPRGLYKKQIADPYHEILIPFKKSPLGIISFFKDNSSNLWAASFGQLYKVVQDTLQPVTHPLVSETRIAAITQTNDGTIYFGTSKGIIIYDGIDYRPLNHKLDSVKIFSLYSDRKGGVWGTTSSGIIHVKNQIIQDVSLPNTIKNDCCHHIALDSSNRLWVASNQGIFSKDLSSSTFTKYDIGKMDSEPLSILFHEHKLYVGLVDGFVVIENPKIVSQEPPSIYITEIKSKKNKWMPNELISLPYKNNSLSITFSAISFSPNSDVEYRYKINDIHTDWQTTNDNTITLTALPSGSHQLLIAAKQNEGVWSKPQTITLQVITPFWKKSWFLLLASSLSLILFFYITRIIILLKDKKKTEQLITQNKIAHLKQQALIALINPHFIFNALNSIQYFLNRNKNDSANEYLSDFARLIRITIDNSKHSLISLKDEIERLGLYLSLEQLRFGEKMMWDIHVDPELNLEEIYIPNMIVQPYVENAVWHGVMPKIEKGLINLHFEKLNTDEIKIMIEDDGVGINSRQEKDDTKEKLGMKITAERLGLLRKTTGQTFEITVKNKTDSSGTIIILRLPLFIKEV